MVDMELHCSGEYISQSTWATQADFEAWARSDKFKKAHQGKGPETTQEERMKPTTAQMLAAPPMAKFYEVRGLQLMLNKSCSSLDFWKAYNVETFISLCVGAVKTFIPQRRLSQRA